MYPHQSLGKIRSVIAARQSENGTDGWPRAYVSPSTGHGAALGFRIWVCTVYAVNIMAIGCTSRRLVLEYSGPFPKPVRGTLTGHIVQGEHRHGTPQDARAEGSMSHYEGRILQIWPPRPGGFQGTFLSQNLDMSDRGLNIDINAQ